MNVKSKAIRKIDSFGPRKSAVFGSIAGVALGYLLARQGDVRKRVSSIDKNAFIEKSKRLRKATKDRWAKYKDLGQNQSKKTVHRVKKAASHLLNQDSENEVGQRAEWSKEEIENLSERLHLVEVKLKDLHHEFNQKETKTGKAAASKKSNGTKGTKKSDSDTAVSSEDDTVAAKK